ncbi:MAG: DMT family transporter [Planctomycetota bacterium]|jgi:drug/metabolite transporter (DMT)-like permease
MAIPYQGEVAALGTAFCWTFTALAFETAGKRIGSLAVNLLRLFMAAGLLILFGLAVRGKPLPSDATAHAWFWLSISSWVGLVIGDGCLFRALVLIGPRLSTLIMSLAPVSAAMLGGLLIGETLTALDMAGMAVTLIGVSWVVLERKPAAGKKSVVSKTGVFLALVGAVGQGGGLVLSKLGMGDYDPFAATQIRIFAAIVGFSVLFIFLGWWPRVIAARKDSRALTFTLIGAFFGPFLGVSLSLMSVQFIATGVAQTIMSIVPVLIIPFVIVIHRERVSFRAVAGAFLAVAGVSLLFLF